MFAASRFRFLNAGTLNKVPPNVSVPHYDRSTMIPRIIHFGPGNFFRCHFARYVHETLEMAHDQHKGKDSQWGIVGVELMDGAPKRQMVEDVRSQNGLYTLTECSPDGTTKPKVVGSILDVLHGPTAPEDVLARIASPETRIISLTITEGGYNIDMATRRYRVEDPAVQHDLAHPHTPTTSFGFIVEGLARRRSAGLGGLTLLSCDNQRGNGEMAHVAVLGYARARDADLANWIEKHVTFPNSMVDRIAPRVDHTDVDRLNNMNHTDDKTPVYSESFSQWVAEDHFETGRPPFEQVGAELRDDVASFEAVKGRMLNATHTMLCYPSLSVGYHNVDEGMSDANIAAFLNQFLELDVIPSVEGPTDFSLEDYKNKILTRFANPAIQDSLLRIGSDTLSKIGVFFSATITHLIETDGCLDRVALLLACFEQYVTTALLKASDPSTPPLQEPTLSDEERAKLHHSFEVVQSNPNPSDEDKYALLQLPVFKGLGLDQNKRFKEVYDATRQRLKNEGAVAAVKFAAAAK